MIDNRNQYFMFSSFLLLLFLFLLTFAIFNLSIVLSVDDDFFRISPEYSDQLEYNEPQIYNQLGDNNPYDSDPNLQTSENELRELITNYLSENYSNDTNILSTDDGLFGIFPPSSYNPNDYGKTGEEEQTIPEQFSEDQTSTEEIPTLSNDDNILQNYLSDVESKNINFIAAGDYNCNKETQKTIEKIIKLEPELVVALGDYTVEEDSPQCWFDISEPIDDIIKIAIGNHDMDYQSSYYQLLDHYNLEKPYYSFNFQNIHFVTISTEHPFEKGSKQYEFIKNDLEESLQDPSILWRIVFFHKPMYTSAEFDEKDSEELIYTFHELFESYQVDLVLSGHTQYYQRSLPLLYNNDYPIYPIIMNENINEYSKQNGIIFVTIGTAGDELHNIDYLLPYYVIQEKKHGFLNFEMTNKGQTLVVTFHDTDSPNILDKFVISKDMTDKKKRFAKENPDPSDNDNNNFYFTSGTEKSEISNRD